MNRKNLTAAVLAGLAGVAGMAGAAQAGSAAVNLNPDGLGEVLLYPYYTTNAGNTTLLTVVNTTGTGKAVKVRFLEGYNSREVLDFNLYLSEYDVWVAALADDAGTPTLLVPDTSCTVPYIYGDFDGEQAMLPYAFTGTNADGGPTDISRAAEGYVEMIEMGTMTGEDGRWEGSIDKNDDGRMDSLTAITHVLDEDGNSMPADCSILVENWTLYDSGFSKPDPWSGWWAEESVDNCGEDDLPGDGDCGQVDYSCSLPGDVYWLEDYDDEIEHDCAVSTAQNSGGLFGGAAIINVANGTMFTYDAKAIQGYDTTTDGVHFYPGTIHPSLNDGNVSDAIVFVGQGQTQRLDYIRSIDAVSAVFMHDQLANTFVIDEDIAAATEWVMTFPTKAWYVDDTLNDTAVNYYTPNPADSGCNGWDPGEPNPYRAPIYQGGSNPYEAGSWWPDDDPPDATNTIPPTGEDWSTCTPLKAVDTDSVAPFTSIWDGEACERVDFRPWDREESPFVKEYGYQPPIVSPAPPLPSKPTETPFEMCYEVNRLQFGDTVIFGEDSDLLYSVGEGLPEAGWARLTFSGSDGQSSCVACGKKPTYAELHEDSVGLMGLPVTGFSAEQYTNGFLAGGVLANYGGLFSHKGSVDCPVIDGGYDCLSNIE